jgi:hypothetical protein
VLPCKGQKIAGVVGVSVRQENGVKSRHVVQLRRTQRIRNPGINERNLAVGSGEAKSAVAKVRDFVLVQIQH